MNEYVRMIEDTTLFRHLSAEDIEQYLRNAKFKVVSYHKNSVLHFAGDVCQRLELILSGKVTLDRIDEAGNLLTVSELSRNDILGCHLLYSSTPYFPMTITAQSPALMLEIDKEILFDILSHNPPFLKAYLGFISDRSLVLGNKIKHYVNKTIRQSILNYLETESQKQNSRHIRLAITKKALAETIGVQRTSLSRELAKMKKNGLVTYDADSITLLK